MVNPYRQLPWIPKEKLRSGRYDCLDCGVNTVEIGHYYNVCDELWNESAAGKGMLCIPCLEGRLKRKLIPDDFGEAPINVNAALCCEVAALRIFGPGHAATTARIKRWFSEMLHNLAAGERDRSEFNRGG